MAGRSDTIGIIGGGPAGMSCALWLKYSGLNPLIIDRRERLGGALLVSEHPNAWVLGQEDCSGIELARRFEAHIHHENISTRLGWSVERILPSEHTLVLSGAGGGDALECAAGVLCTGMRYTGREAFAQVSGFAAVEDRITFGQPSIAQAETLQGNEIAVLGGGDNAYEAALALAGNGCKVTLLMRGTRPRAKRALQDAAEQAAHDGNLHLIRNAALTAFKPLQSKAGVILESGPVVQAVHIFALLGYVPDTAWLGARLPDLSLDGKGFIKTDEWMRTSVPRLYAAGDIVAPNHPCVVGALSTGSLAARCIEKDMENAHFPG